MKLILLCNTLYNIWQPAFAKKHTQKTQKTKQKRLFQKKAQNIDFKNFN